jgi:catechol 2,3-dioxygenase-like lactoylglutathione lyase family enzyme
VALVLDHVQLAMPRGGESLADDFYVGLLGLTALEKPAVLAVRGGRWYALGEHQLHLGVEEDFRPSAKAHVALVCDSFDDLLAQLRHANVRVIDDEALEDVVRAYAYDPFGNRLELIKASR